MVNEAHHLIHIQMHDSRLPLDVEVNATFRPNACGKLISHLGRLASVLEIMLPLSPPLCVYETSSSMVIEGSHFCDSQGCNRTRAEEYTTKWLISSKFVLPLCITRKRWMVTDKTAEVPGVA